MLAVADLGGMSTRLSKIASDASVSPSSRIAELRRIAEMADDEEVAGACASLIGSLDLQRESEAMLGQQELLIARENADIREVLLAEEVATAQQLGAAGYFSHDELDHRADDGTLAEAFGVIDPEILRKLAARRRRAPGGQFADEFSKLGGLATPKLKGRGGKALGMPKAPKPHVPEQQPKVTPSVLARTVANAIGIDPYDADVGKLKAHAADHENNPISRLKLGSPCARNKNIDFAVHVWLPTILQEKHPELAKRLQDTSPRWGHRHDEPLNLPKPLNPDRPGLDFPLPEALKHPPERPAPIKVGGDVKRAAQLLSEGHHVELDQPRSVSTLLDHLTEMVKEAERKGDAAPQFDLCKVSVPGTNLFCAETKGIKRIEMPQLKGVVTPGSPADRLPKDANGETDLGPVFRNYLADRGVKISDTSIPSSNLRASQNELNGAKVAGMTQAMREGKFKNDQPIFVSNDDYIVDGHHRWAAQVATDTADNKLGDVDTPVAQVDMSITELLDEAKRFAEEMGVPSQGITRPERKGDAKPVPLTDDHSLYIDHDPAKHPVVPVSKLIPTKPPESQPESVANAARLMNKAAKEGGSKRKPIDVIDNGDGTYSVKDGNATTGAAQVGGLTKMPVNIVGKRDGQAAPMRTVFHEEEAVKPTQHFGGRDELFAAAEEAHPLFDELLGGEDSLATAIGAVVPADFEEAIANNRDHPDKPQVILAPIKGIERSTQKVEQKYDGDWNRLQDTVRGTVVVPTLDDMPAAVEALRARAEKAGWTIRKAESRWDDPPPPHNTGPTPAGYRDAAVALIAPNGLVTELQFNTAPMMRAKQGEGHTLYEESRTLEAEIKKRTPASPGTSKSGTGAIIGPTPEELKRLAEIDALSKKLYGAAYEESLG